MNQKLNGVVENEGIGLKQYSQVYVQLDSTSLLGLESPMDSVFPSMIA